MRHSPSDEDSLTHSSPARRSGSAASLSVLKKDGSIAPHIWYIRVNAAAQAWTATSHREPERCPQAPRILINSTQWMLDLPPCRQLWGLERGHVPMLQTEQCHVSLASPHRGPQQHLLPHRLVPGISVLICIWARTQRLARPFQARRKEGGTACIAF